MADLRISELTDGGAAQAADELPVSRTAGVATRKVTAQTIADLAAANAASAVASETSNRVSADNALSNALSNEASVRSVADASLAQGISVVSVAINVVSAAVSALSQANSVQHAALSNAISVASAAATSADAHAAAASAAATSVAGVASLAISVVSHAVSVLSQANSAAHAALSVRIDTVSNGVSVVSVAIGVVSNNLSALSDAHTSLVNRVSANSGVGGGGSATPTSAGYLSLVDRVSANSGVGGGGSVTSTEVSAGDAAVSLQAASALSQALSVLSVMDAGLSTRVTSVADFISNLLSSFNQVSARSVGDVSTKGFQSIFNALSNRISVGDSAVSAAVTSVAAVASLRDSAISAAVTSVAAVDSLAVSVVSHAVSVLSQANSASHASIAQAISVVSQTLSVLSTAHTSLVNRVSANSGTGGGGSVTSDEVSAVGTLSLQNVGASAMSAAQVVYAFTSANTMKKAQANDQITKRAIGIVLDTAIAISAVGRIKYGGIASFTTAQWDAVTGGSGGLTPGSTYYLSDSTAGNLTTTAPAIARPVGVALTTTEMKLHIQSGDDWMTTAIAADISNLVSAAAAVSLNVSALSTAVSVLSNAVSALSVAVAAAGSFQQRSFVTTGLTVSAATLTNIPSLSLSLDAGAMYNLEGKIMFDTGVSGGGMGFGISLPAMAARGTGIRMEVQVNEVQNVLQGATTNAVGFAAFSSEAAGSSLVVSTFISTINSPRMVIINGLINTSAAGILQIMAKCSAAAGAIIIRSGFIKAYKIN